MKRKKSFLLGITDEELFYSSWLKKEYEDLSLALTGRADPRIVVNLMRCGRDEACFAARTNGNMIQVHPFAKTFAGLSRLERYGVIYGVVVHEIAHVLYTDFRCHIFCPTGGKMQETKRRILRDTGVNIDDLSLTAKAWIADIQNCIEDGYIENAFRTDYAGVPSIYLKKARAFMAKGYEPVAVMRESLGVSAPFVSNCTLMYSTTGRLDFKGVSAEDELAKKLVRLMDIIDDAVVDTDQINRWVAAVRIYQFFEDEFAKGAEPSRDTSDVEGNAGSTAPEKPKEIKDHRKKKKHKKTEEEAKPEESKDDDGKKVESGDAAEAEKPENDDTEDAADTDSSSRPLFEDSEEDEVEAPDDSGAEEIDVFSDEDEDEDGLDLSDLTGSGGIGSSDEDGESEEADGDFDDSDYDDESDDEDENEDFADDAIREDLEASVGRVMKGIAEEKEEEETNAERKEDAEGASSESSGDFKLVPTNPVPWQASPDAASKYARVMDKVRPISKRLQRSLISELQDREYGSKRSGLLIGKRFEARNAYRMDMRAFSTNKAPTELKSLAVAVLVDLSGSMSSGIRIPTAIETAVLVQDFCSGLNFPVAVYGHAADYDGCNVYTFTEWSDKGKEMIADMHDLWDNHDGHALRYVKKRLLKRPEPNKLLIYISDGQPANHCWPGVYYSGPRAIADLKNFVKEAKKDSVSLICAGIGADKDQLSSIYGDAFMDISDLAKLPVLIVRCIKRMIAQVE